MPAYLAYVKKALPLLEVGNSAPSPSWRSGLGNSAPRLPAIMPPGVREQSSLPSYRSGTVLPQSPGGREQCSLPLLELEVGNSAPSPPGRGSRERYSVALLEVGNSAPSLLLEVGSSSQCSLLPPPRPSWRLATVSPLP